MESLTLETGEVHSPNWGEALDSRSNTNDVLPADAGEDNIQIDESAAPTSTVDPNNVISVDNTNDPTNRTAIENLNLNELRRILRNETTL